MKKLTILMLALICTEAMAKWSKLEDTHALGSTVYADIDNIRNKGMTKVKMRHLINLPHEEVDSSGQAYLSVKEYVEYNCDEEHYRVLATSKLAGVMGSGKVVSFSSEARLWQPVELDTLEETLWKIACNKSNITRHD